MKVLTEEELKALRDWVDAQKVPLEPKGCACSLVRLCMYHAGRQKTHASALPPRTVERLLYNASQSKKACALVSAEIVDIMSKGPHDLREERDAALKKLKALQKVFGGGCECCVEYECDCMEGVTW